MFTKIVKNNILQALETLNLSENGRELFSLLLERGPSRASSLAKVSGIRRELIYRALEELEKAELVKKIDVPQSVALFQAIHPEALLHKFKNAQAGMTAIHNVLESQMSSLVGTYNKAIGLPHVEFKEGKDGLKYLYDDVIATGESVYLVRSPIDVRDSEIKKLISDHKERQIKHKIHTFIVSSVGNPRLTIKEVIARDKKNLVTRHLTQRDLLNIPAQIMIYGEKVAITSFEDTVVTTIIENKAICDTFKILFNILWNLGKPVVA